MQKLSNVTRSIIALIDAELQRRTPNPVFDVVASPPGAGEGAAVHVYLYHAKECPHNKNLPAPGGAGPIPIQHTPLVLILQYMVTVVHATTSQDPDSPYDEQDYIGYVARAIHDYPILTHETVLTDGTVLSDLESALRARAHSPPGAPRGDDFLLQRRSAKRTPSLALRRGSRCAHRSGTAGDHAPRHGDEHWHRRRPDERAHAREHAE
ncbi:MAG: Pvc16 family protein [Polyangiaceae bacterium]